MSRNKEKFIEDTIPYKMKINNTIDYLDKDKRNSFKKALIYHKFDEEVYIPQTMSINKIEYKNKNYLLNKLVKFNSDLYKENQILNKIQKENEKFTRQYQLVKSENEAVQNEYLKRIEEVYKIKGYNPKLITYIGNENMFDPSVLLEEEEKYPLTVKIENKTDIHRDMKYLYKFEELLKEKKGKTKEEEAEELERKNNNLEKKNVTFKVERKDSIISDDYAAAKEDIKKKIMEELRIKNMSLKELRQMNFNLMQEIKQTQTTLNNIGKDDDIFSKKKKYVMEGTFLSSKGMLRSAKKRHNDQDKSIQEKEKINILIQDNLLDESKEKNKKEENKEEEKKEEEKKEEEKRKKIKSMTQRERRALFQKEKQSRLTKLYYNILKSNFKDEEKNIKDYINNYCERKTTDVNLKYGSNLHGLLSDFQNYIEKTNIPNLANEVNEAMRDMNRINISSDSKFGKKITLESIRNTEDLFDLDEKINQLGYDYTENLLQNKY